MNARDQINAFENSQAGFAVADYTPSTRVARFRWVGESEGVSYTCRVESAVASPMRGVLTYERAGKVVATGTCDAITSQTP